MQEVVNVETSWWHWGKDTQDVEMLREEAKTSFFAVAWDPFAKQDHRSPNQTKGSSKPGLKYAGELLLVLLECGHLGPNLTSRLHKSHKARTARSEKNHLAVSKARIWSETWRRHDQWTCPGATCASLHGAARRGSSRKRCVKRAGRALAAA